jgi:hypothetical protein
MTKIFGPFNQGVGASLFETQWSTMMRTVFKDGVVNGYLNELLPYGDSTGMQVKVRNGAGWIKGHYYQNDAEETKAISTANPSNPRWDLVVLEVDWTKTDNQMSVVVVVGTPAASPSLPSLTQNTSKWQIPLAKVVVGAGVTTIAAGNVIDSRLLVSYMMVNGVVHKQLWIGGWRPMLTGGCAAPVQIEQASNKNVYDYLAFDPTTAEGAYVNIVLPQDYSGGQIYFNVYWTHPTTAVNFGTTWVLYPTAVGDNEALDAPFSSYVQVSDWGGVANKLYISPLSSSLLITGSPTNGKLCNFKLVRYPADASDTLAVDAYLIGVMIWYPVR